MIVAGVVFLMMHAQQSPTVYLIDLKTWMQAKKAPLSQKKIPILVVSELASPTIFTMSCFEQISVRHQGRATNPVIIL